MDNLDSYLGGYSAGNQMAEQGRQQRTLATIQSLAPQVIGGDPQALAKVAAVDPQAAASLQDTGDSQLRKLQGFVKYVDNARASGNPSAVAAALKVGGPYITQLTGRPAPSQWTPDMDEGWEQLKAQVAMAGGQQQMGADQFTLGPGSKRFDAAGNVVAEVPFAPANSTITTVADGMGGTNQMIWDPRARTMSPLPNTNGSFYEDGSRVNVMQGIGADGTPYSFDPSMSADDRALAMADMASGGSLTTATLPDRNVTPQQFARGGKLGYTPPKPEISAAEQIRLTMAERAASRADEAARDASAARQEAADQRRRGEEEKRQKADMAAQQAISSVTDSLGTIQRLRNHSGYRQLGTVIGDAALSTPLIRTDAKGANALLETIKSQMLINTLQSLKAASSTGASGFGSLTEREGDALRAAIANLTTAQSHEDLDSAIGQVENVLTRSLRQLSASAPRQAAPDRPQSNAIPQRARNPQTGQVIELRNGQWVPVQ